MSAVDTLEKATEIAKGKGLVVLQPKPNELFVDIDNVGAELHFRVAITILNEKIGCSWSVRPSPSGAPHRLHATVVLARDVVDNAERILLQALLGSDILHEILSWRAHLNGHPCPTLFFEKPDLAGTVQT